MSRPSISCQRQLVGNRLLNEMDLWPNLAQLLLCAGLFQWLSQVFSNPPAVSGVFLWPIVIIRVMILERVAYNYHLRRHERAMSL